jgi:hypothetical protein
MNYRFLPLMRIACAVAFAFSTIFVDAQVLDGLTQNASKTPTLAYSLRKLKAAYTGPAVRVRNAAGAELRDVYFDSNGLVSLNSPISAAGGGAATATTLTTWIGSGTCFITTWYDQSGNGRNATNPAAVQTVNGALTTNGTTVTLGTAAGTAAVYSFTTSAATSNATLTVATAPGTSVVGMAISGTGIPVGTFATVSGTTISLTNAVNVSSGSTFYAYGTTNSYQPGNMLVDNQGKLIGIIKDVDADKVTMTLTSAAPTNTTYLAGGTWGLATQPTLVLDGVIETIPGTAMPAMRMYNGYNSNTRFNIPNFDNDGGAGVQNLQNMKGINIFAIMRMDGNFTGPGVTSGQSLFATTSPNSGTAGKLSMQFLTSSTLKQALRGYVGATVITGVSYGPVIKTSQAVRYSINNTSGKALMSSSVSGTPAAGTAVTPAFDNTQIQIFGHSGQKNRLFEGLASEMIFYGTTTTTDWDETDAVALYNDEKSYIGFPTVTSPTVTNVAATSATIGANVTAAGATTVTARGTYYDTNTFPTANGATTAGTTGTFTRDITGLTTNTKYYYRGYATNTAGTNYSVDGSFTTLPAAPTIATASAVTASGFTANWTAPTQGAETFTYTVEYGTASDLAGATAIGGITSGNLNNLITGLTASTNYYYRVKAVNTQGAGAWSAIQSVTTAAPTVISSDVNVSDLSLATSSVVSVENGGRLSLNQPTNVYSMALDSISNLNVNNNAVTVGALTLKAGKTNSFSAKIDETITATSVRFLKTIDDKKWYFMSFPCTITVADIKLSNGNSIGTLGASGEWFIKEYNGSQRAISGTTLNNWSHISSATLTANKGYIFGMADGMGTKEIAFPLSTDVLIKEVEKGISVTAYTGAAGGNNYGWNLIGQPYLSRYTGSGANINFMTFSDGISEYTQYSKFSATLPLPSINPFAAYFVQVGVSSPISFALTSRQGVQAMVDTPQSDIVELNVSNATGSDVTTFIMDNDQSVTYQIGQDLEKWLTLDTFKPQVYSVMNGVNYAYNSLPMSNVQNLSIGIYSKVAVSTTIKANGTQAPNLEKLMLVDKVTGVVTDLLNSNYTFTATVGTINNRFTISAQRIPTESELIISKLNEPVVSMINGKLSIANIMPTSTIRVFDALGRIVVNKIANSNLLEIDMLPKGMYSVQLQLGNRYITKKVIN